MKADNSTFGRFSAGGHEIVLDEVAAIAKRGGDAIMDIYNNTPLAEWKAIADFKADGSPLTKADTTANKIICDALRELRAGRVCAPSCAHPARRVSAARVEARPAARDQGARYPKIPIMSEEFKMAPYAERQAWTHFWCVDPLDGTKEFIKRNGQFTVNIGLVAGTAPIAGVVYVPAAADGPVMYKGAKGLGPPVREVDDPLGYDSFKSIFVKTRLGEYRGGSPTNPR
eukprot:CAMPEP_0119266168 /NCGR_PEP_ID=MMETSP1329-20130426/4750_1 /TAXON_ID=114041 /ORGANISM="Genus nov. species nov., Strain RCC1024" /LENGTH=227 /DNA_ID=CAMNT_0007266035 /DNA_START=159 /DNA_END=838 /DNA_ORIENTATION=+